MKGSICFRKIGEGGYYYVSWYIGKKQYKINKYKGIICRDRSMAERLLAVMRSDEENNVFRIEKFLYQTIDVIPFLEEWLEKETHLSPATKKDYHNSIQNHLKPWFEAHPVMLHEIQYDTLCKLLNDIKREGKGKLNVLYCLHAALKSAARSGRILKVPEFPEKKRYQIEPTVIDAIPEARQIAVIQSIPIQHQPIFWWMKYHFRRPCEAIPLHKVDYDEEQDCFIVRRSISNNQIVDHTKTHRIHYIPCHPEFKPWMNKLHKSFGDYFFTHKTSRLEGKRYQHHFLGNLWNEAAKKCGEAIRMYAGLKHSSCTAFVNEQGGSVDELQMLTDHARRDSVMKYTQIKLETKRRIQGKVISIRTGQQEHSKNM